MKLFNINLSTVQSTNTEVVTTEIVTNHFMDAVGGHVFAAPAYLRVVSALKEP
jgi:hypothetical protein